MQGIVADTAREEAEEVAVVRGQGPGIGGLAPGPPGQGRIPATALGVAQTPDPGAGKCC